MWRPPTEDEAEDLMLIAFVDCLGVLMTRSGVNWARKTIESLFTTCYHERSRIPEPLRTKMINWQADLKRGVKPAAVGLPEVRGTMEAKNAFIDARETRMS